MSDNIAILSGEDSTEECETIQSYGRGSKGAMLRPYFRAYSEKGKIYNECLIKGCDRSIAGQQTCNLKRHLRRIHGIVSISETTEALIDGNRSEDNGKNENAIEIAKVEMQKFRKYFRTFRADGIIISKCLVNGCERRMVGKQKCNLMRHLRDIHKFNPMLNQTDADNAVQPPQIVTRQRKTARTEDVGQFFESVTEQGRQYSVCLIKNCCRRFEGSHIENLKIHLTVAHNMNLDSASADDSSDDDDDQNESDQCDENASRQSNEKLDVVAAESIGNEGVSVNEKSMLHRSDAETSRSVKYFRIFRQDGKIYSKCLVKGCKRTMAGQSKCNLARHLRIIHKLLIHLPRRANLPEAYASTAEVPLNTVTVTNTKKIPYFFPAGIDFRKYFKIVTERDRIYSKCLIKGCERRMAGKFSGNLVRHLRLIHGAQSHSKSKDGTSGDENTANPIEEEFDESVQVIEKSRENVCAPMPNLSEGSETTDNKFHGSIDRNAAEDKETPLQKVLKARYLPRRKYFRTVRQNGKIYSECLIESCRRRLAGKLKCNLMRHLRLVHAIELTTEDVIRGRNPIHVMEEAKLRQYFQIIVEEGKTFSKCLIEGCERQLAGQVTGNLKRHLRLIHQMDSLLNLIEESSNDDESEHNAERTLVSEFDSEQDQSEENEDENHDINAGSSVNESETPVIENNELAIPSDLREYFSTITEDGKIFSKCLIEGCDRRLAGKIRSNMTRHLRSMHMKNSPIKAIVPKDNEETENLRENQKMSVDTTESDQVRENDAQFFVASTSFDADLVDDDKADNSMDEDTSESNRDSSNHINTPILSDWKNYFATIRENGKVYSKCLIEGCKRRLSGLLKGNMLRHLRLVHSQKSLTKSRNHTSPHEESTENHEHLTKIHVQANETDLERENSSETFHRTDRPMSIDMSENNESNIHEPDSRYQKYFRIFRKNGKTYSKCLMEGCDRHLAGRLTCNMKRHLRLIHHINPPSTSRFMIDDHESDHESEMSEENTEDNTVQMPPPAFQPPPKFRKYFTTITEKGKTYSMCLIKGCERRLAGQVKNNLVRHLRLMHSDHSQLVSPQTCRLCFEQKDDVIDIFSNELNIASAIRLHFAPDEVENFSKTQEIFLLINLFFRFQVNENDSLPKNVCLACWWHLENFHKFYLAVNQAKSNYMAMENDSPNFCEVLSNTDTVSFKAEPQEMIECVTADNWQQDDIVIENLVPEATIDKRDFDAVFCEEFIPDCDAMMEEIKDGTSAIRYADHCQENVRSANASREKLTIRIKPECRNTVEGRTSSKRTADHLVRKLICEFCVKTFATLTDIEVHYEREHNIQNGQSTLYHKRVK